MDKVKIFNGKVITQKEVIPDWCIILSDGRIEYAGPDNPTAADAGDIREMGSTGDCRKIDAKGNFISPGFLDIHTHGGGGHDFMDGTEEAYLGAARMHALHGTTSLVPTTLACTNEELKKTFSVFREAKAANKEGAAFLGLHLEGPYFSMEQRGAQDPKYIRNPRKNEYEEILSWSDDIVRWSAAPELDGALEFAGTLKKQGILPAIAHSDAIYEQVAEAFKYGFTHITHLYSGMSGVRRINAYRYAGVIESAYLIDDMTVEIIADGAHLPASLLKLVYKIKGPDRIALVTDSMRAAGLPEGESIIGSLDKGQKVIVEDGVAKLPDRSAFAGSVATADRLVRTMLQLAQVPLPEAVKMMTATPAAIIGAGSTKGSLQPGKDADIILFDQDINVKMTMIRGKVIHSSL